MNWIRITVKTTTEGSDVVSEILSGISAGGVIIEDAADIRAYNRPKEEWDYIDENLAQGYDEEVCVRGFISEEDDLSAAEQFIAQELQKIKGVGKKVAECTLLYGFGKYEAFPEDVWVKRIMAEMYPDGLPACTKGSEGIAQQYLFHWRRTVYRENL